MFRTSPVLPEKMPNDELVGLNFAPPQLGWFKTSNASARNWKPVFSVTAIFLKRPTFQFSNPGLCTMLRTLSWCTNVPFAGCVKNGVPPAAAHPLNVLAVTEQVWNQ